MRLVIANADVLVGACERAAGRFALMNQGRVDRTSISELSSIKNDIDAIVIEARLTMRSEALDASELTRSAQCTGVTLRENKVIAMMVALEALKSRLIDEAAGLSIDMPLNLVRAQTAVAGIDQRLTLLRQISSQLFDVTALINRRILRNAG